MGKENFLLSRFRTPENEGSIFTNKDRFHLPNASGNALCSTHSDAILRILSSVDQKARCSRKRSADRDLCSRAQPKMTFGIDAELVKTRILPAIVMDFVLARIVLLSFCVFKFLKLGHEGATRRFEIKERKTDTPH